MARAAGRVLEARCRINVTRGAARFDQFEILCPELIVVHREVVKQFPGVEATFMAIRKDKFEGIRAHRFDSKQLDITLACLQDFLTRSVPARFRLRRVDTQIFEIETVNLACGILQFKYATLGKQTNGFRHRYWRSHQGNLQQACESTANAAGLSQIDETDALEIDLPAQNSIHADTPRSLIRENFNFTSGTVLAGGKDDGFVLALRAWGQ